MGKLVIINKVKEKWGELGNMAPFEIEFLGKTWPRSEHLFQALRLSCPVLQEEIRAIKNPMAAKMRAKKLIQEHPDKVDTTPLSDNDLANMKLVLELKLRQNPKVQGVLMMTGDREIVEDATRRQRGSGLFWGAALQEDGTWKGKNMLGKLWMELREELLEG